MDFHRFNGTIGRICLTLLSGGLLTLSAMGQDPAEFFKRNCFSCHTVGGGRVTGPDLKDVESRRNREWLVNFIMNPQRVLDSGDPYAANLLTEARGVIMPTVPGMTADMATVLLDLIAAESALDESHFIGLQISDEPFSAEQMAEGRALFQGTQPLASGPMSCLSCHAVAGVGALGGGRLGPDLTRVYERLGGRKGLATWLLAPATPTMRSIFQQKNLTQEEILSVVAFLEESAADPAKADPAVDTLNFFLMGLGGAVSSLALFGVFWRNRFRSVRRALLQKDRLHRGTE